MNFGHPSTAERTGPGTMHSLRHSVLMIAACTAACTLVILFPRITAAEEQPSCIDCHQGLDSGTSVHAAVSMGCASCHSAVDATEVPHKFTNRNPKGLMSKMRDLCYSCHDKTSFMKKTVHGAIMLGCTSCHDPHASKQARLLKEDIPALCITCHKDRFTPGTDGAHILAGNEACASCHEPHASDSPKLMQSGPTTTVAVVATNR